jgi:hypothetical protein
MIDDAEGRVERAWTDFDAAVESYDEAFDAAEGAESEDERSEHLARACRAASSALQVLGELRVLADYLDDEDGDVRMGAVNSLGDVWTTMLESIVFVRRCRETGPPRDLVARRASIRAALEAELALLDDAIGRPSATTPFDPQAAAEHCFAVLTLVGQLRATGAHNAAARYEWDAKAFLLSLGLHDGHEAPHAPPASDAIREAVRTIEHEAIHAAVAFCLGWPIDRVWVKYTGGAGVTGEVTFCENSGDAATTERQVHERAMIMLAPDTIGCDGTLGDLEQARDLVRERALARTVPPGEVDKWRHDPMIERMVSLALEAARHDVRALTETLEFRDARDAIRVALCYRGDLTAGHVRRALGVEGGQS